MTTQPAPSSPDRIDRRLAARAVADRAIIVEAPARRSWRVAIPAALALVFLIGLGAVAFRVLTARDTDLAAPGQTHPTGALPPRIDAPFAPATLRPLSQEQARVWNRQVAISAAPTVPAAMFLLQGAQGSDYARSLQCLTSAIYYEAASESDDGERAVAQVVLNRLRHPAYPKTVCGVVFEGATRRTGCQFSFACDGSLARPPSAPGWRRASRIAASALGGAVFAPVGWATHYHADWIVPYWAARLSKVATIGAHIFYRWPGGWGEAQAFRGRYRGGEPALGSLIAGRPVAEAKTEKGQSEASMPVPAPDRPVLPIRPTAPQGAAPIVGLDERRILPMAEAPAEH